MSQMTFQVNKSTQKNRPISDHVIVPELLKLHLRKKGKVLETLKEKVRWHYP